jgi:hypothetical protein
VDRHTFSASPATDNPADIHRVYPAIRDNPQKVFPEPTFPPQGIPQAAAKNGPSPQQAPHTSFTRS